jgi:hypothetical protein
MMEKIFRHKGVEFEVLKEGEKALLLSAKSDFYDCESMEVWQIKERPDMTIGGKFVAGGLKKPGNNDYPFWAHQFMRKHYTSDEAFLNVVEKRFQEYEQGLRPKKLEEA